MSQEASKQQDLTEGSLTEGSGAEEVGKLRDEQKGKTANKRVFHYVKSCLSGGQSTYDNESKKWQNASTQQSLSERIKSIERYLINEEIITKNTFRIVIEGNKEEEEQDVVKESDSANEPEAPRKPAPPETAHKLSFPP